MLWLLLSALLVLTGCGPGLTFNLSEMTREQMLDQASHVFIGVIEGQHFDPGPFSVSPESAEIAGDPYAAGSGSKP